MRILLGSQDAARDREAFFTAQVLFWLLVAPDGHAKNFSVFIERGGRFRLTPLYDIKSAYPVIGHGSGHIPRENLKPAMAFKGKDRHCEWGRISPRHIREIARLCGFESFIGTVMERLTREVPKATQEVARHMPSDFPTTISDSILQGIEARAKQLHVE